MMQKRDLEQQDAANSVSTSRRALKVRRRRGDVPFADPTVTLSPADNPGSDPEPEPSRVAVSRLGSHPPGTRWVLAWMRTRLPG